MHLCLSLSSASSNDLKPAVVKTKKSKFSTGRVYEQPTKEDILLRKEQELKRSNLFRQQAERQREERQRASAERRQKCFQRLDDQCTELENAVVDPNSDAGSLQHGLNELMKECNVAQTFQQVNASSILSRCKVIQQRIQPTELEMPVAAVAAAAKSSSIVTKKQAPNQGKRKGPDKKAPAKDDDATLSVDSDDSDYHEPPTKKKSSKKPSKKKGRSSVARGAGSSSQSRSKVKVKTGGRKSSSRSASLIGNSKFVFIFHQPQYQLHSHSLIISANAKTGKDSYLHRSQGGGITNAINERRGGTGPTHIAAAIKNPSTTIVDTATSADVAKLQQGLRKMCKERTVVKINTAPEPMKKIAKKLQIARDATSTDAERKKVITKTFTSTGCNVISNIDLVRQSDKKVQSFMFVILPQGMEVDDMHELTASKQSRHHGTIISLCKEERCLKLPMAGKKRCADCDNKEKMCSVCNEAPAVKEQTMCYSCRDAANKAKLCKVPTCNNNRLSNRTTCSNACQTKLSDYDFCQKCNEKVVVDTSQFDDREWYEDCQGLLCVDCWKEPVKLCRYCQVRIATRGAQCLPCEKTEKEKTSNNINPFTCRIITQHYNILL